MSTQLNDECLRRKVGKSLIALSFPAAPALPAWSYLLPVTCGEDLTLGTAALFFSSPLFTVGGWLLLISRSPTQGGPIGARARGARLEADPSCLGTAANPTLRPCSP